MRIKILKGLKSLKIKSIINKSENKLTSYTFKEEIISEVEKVEKEYVLQLVNQRLIAYFDNLNKKL